jgi:hypothetical protein
MQPQFFLKNMLTGASSAATLMMVVSQANAMNPDAKINDLKEGGAYTSSDFHNHTTCTDGNTSVKTLTDQSTVVYGLDWFSQSGHGGSFSRDCRFDDDERDGAVSGNGQWWQNTIGVENIKGDAAFSGSWGCNELPEGECRVMWRWQSLQEFVYFEAYAAGAVNGKPVFTGLEWNVPGHEHSSNAILDGQFPAPVKEGNPPPEGEVFGNANALAEFHYLWDRNDNDTSGGGGQGWGPKTPNMAGDHAKAVDAIAWARENYPDSSYVIPAHVERQGGYVPTENRGFNVEHFRNFYNAGLLNGQPPNGESIAMGFESQPGHQAANGGRGTYRGSRPSACFNTYGGTGCYAAAIASLPQTNFDGSSITLAQCNELQATQGFSSSVCANTPERIVLGKPGVGGMWDALLGEGRRWFFYASSDWHNRGAFGAFEPQTTLDFWPGEYQKNYGYQDFDNDDPGLDIVESLRSGNNYAVQGDLIEDFYFVACYDQTNQCATMGETLEVSESLGGKVDFQIRLVDPEGKNNSYYTFPNPSIYQTNTATAPAINEPVLHHVDVITGDVTGIISPGSPLYAGSNTNPTTKIFFTFNEGNWDARPEGEKRLEWTVNVMDMINGSVDGAEGMYVRVRGTNIPQATPNETDANGNPLSDALADNIPCPFVGTGDDPKNRDACPDHLPVKTINGQETKIVDADVEALSDLWFYANPIYIQYTATPPGPTVTNPNTPGIMYNKGQTVDITWAGFNGSQVKIHLYEGDRYVQRIPPDITPNDGLYSWTIPSSLSSSQDYRVQIISASDSSERDFSDHPFTITD